MVPQITLFAPPAGSFKLQSQFQAPHKGPALLAAANQLLCRAPFTHKKQSVHIGLHRCYIHGQTRSAPSPRHRNRKDLPHPHVLAAPAVLGAAAPPPDAALRTRRWCSIRRRTRSSFLPPTLSPQPLSSSASALLLSASICSGLYASSCLLALHSPGAAAAGRLVAFGSAARGAAAPRCCWSCCCCWGCADRCCCVCCLMSSRAPAAGAAASAGCTGRGTHQRVRQATCESLRRRPRHRCRKPLLLTVCLLLLVGPAAVKRDTSQLCCMVDVLSSSTYLCLVAAADAWRLPCRPPGVAGQPQVA